MRREAAWLLTNGRAGLGHGFRARLALGDGDRAAALVALSAAAAAEDHSADYLQLVARTYEELHEFERARRVLDTLWRKLGHDRRSGAAILAGMARLDERLGEPKLALQRLMRANALHQRPQYAARAAGLALDTGARPLAEELVSAARRRWRARQAGLLRALRDAHAVVAPSRFLARRARELGLDRDVVAIPNGLAAAPGSSAVSPERPPGPLSVGFFGNPHPTKGLDLLLRAFASLPAGAAELHVHGTSDASGPGVVAHGRYAPADAVGLMRTVDVVAIPSTWAENHPLVALEARAAGRPLLVADLGGLPELVAPGRDGWIVPPDDPEAWGERLALLAATLPRVRSLDVPPPPTAEAMAEAYLDVWRARPSAALSSPESRQKGR